jgi:hypothetical protein
MMSPSPRSSEDEVDQDEDGEISAVDSDEENELLGPPSPKRPRMAHYLDKLLNKGKEKEEAESASWLEKAQNKYAKPQEKGPKVQQDLADLVNFLGTDSAIQEKVADVVIPENLDLKTPKVNPEIYSGMSERSRYMEKSFQGINQAINAGISLVAYSIDAMSDVKGDKAEVAKLKLIDASSTLTRATQALSQLRREALRYEIPSNLKSLISKAPNNQDMLFGNDLKEAVDDAEAREKLKNKVSKPNYKTNPKNDYRKGKYGGKQRQDFIPKKGRGGYNNYNRDNYNRDNYNKNSRDFKNKSSRGDRKDYRPRQY